MRLKATIAVLTGVLALTAATALAAQPEGSPPYGKGKGNGPVYTPGEPGNPTPGPNAGLPAQAKAYGRYCKGQSKKHVKGEKGTEFSRCVKAMAKAVTNERINPSKACKGLSKEHVKGEKGTAFSRCVKAAAQAQKDHQEGES